MKSLKDKECVPCEGGVEPLNKDEIKRYLERVENWELLRGPDRIQKKVELEDFKTVMERVNEIAEMADKEGHHPNIHIEEWNNLRVEIYTHAIEGLHENDFIVASKVNEILNED